MKKILVTAVLFGMLAACGGKKSSPETIKPTDTMANDAADIAREAEKADSLEHAVQKGNAPDSGKIK